MRRHRRETRLHAPCTNLPAARLAALPFAAAAAQPGLTAARGERQGGAGARPDPLPGPHARGHHGLRALHRRQAQGRALDLHPVRAGPRAPPCLPARTSGGSGTPMPQATAAPTGLMAQALERRGGTPCRSEDSSMRRIQAVEAVWFPAGRRRACSRCASGNATATCQPSTRTAPARPPLPPPPPLVRLLPTRPRRRRRRPRRRRPRARRRLLLPHKSGAARRSPRSRRERRVWRRRMGLARAPARLRPARRPHGSAAPTPFVLAMATLLRAARRPPALGPMTRACRWAGPPPCALVLGSAQGCLLNDPSDCRVCFPCRVC